MVSDDLFNIQYVQISEGDHVRDWEICLEQNVTPKPRIWLFYVHCVQYLLMLAI
jgi:hypothetical protein